jgi:hypothetical protein
MGKPKNYIYKFDTAEKFWDATQMPEVCSLGRESRASGEGFSGTSTFEEATKLARFGWPEGLRRVSSISAKINGAIGSYIPVEECVRDVVGEFVDVGAFLSGEPESMIRLETHTEDRKGGRIIKIVYNTSASCGVAKEILMRRGAVACSLIDALGRIGFLAELVVSEYASSGDNLFGVEIIVKRPEEPLNMDRVAFAVGHPSMLRRMMFSFEETLPREIRGIFGFHPGSGYGSPADAPQDRQGDVYFEAMHGSDSNYKTEASAVQAAFDVLKSHGFIDDEQLVA